MRFWRAVLQSRLPLKFGHDALINKISDSGIMIEL